MQNAVAEKVRNAGVEEWKDRIKSAIENGEIRVSRRGVINRDDMKGMTGYSSQEAQRAKKIVQNTLQTK